MNNPVIFTNAATNPAVVPTPKLSVNAGAFTPNTKARPFVPTTKAAPAPVVEAPKPYVAPVPVVPKDVTKDKFERWTHTERETNDFKGIIKTLTGRKLSEPISMDLFK